MVNFVLGVHCHQPLDNFPSVVEDVFASAYRPFLEVVKQFDRVRVNLHLSGPLLDQLEARHPEYLAELKTLAGAGQIEFLVAGRYEPILTLLPEPDRRDQLAAGIDQVTRLFGVRPRGLWLTERVWEQHLAQTIAQAGLDYVVVDDAHFRKVGVPASELSGYYVTEDQGVPLAVFGVSRQLRYLVPFRPVTEVRQWLQGQDRTPAPSTIVLFDDGEKFGAWPGTFEHVYRAGWLQGFCSTLCRDPLIRFALLSEVLDRTLPSGRIYLDNASYEEMDEWVLPPERLRQYERLRERLKPDVHEPAVLRTGYFRNFLVRYPEANQLHKRMIFISNKIRRSRQKTDRKQAARIELFKAQGNDVYWHGIFGGLYLPHLRFAAYRHLLEADRILKTRTGIQVLDYDACGQKEVVFDTEQLFLVVAPARGGTISALDIKTQGIAWLDTMTRRAESYHQRLRTGTAHRQVASIHDQALTAPAGLEQLLIYDRIPRYTLTDHCYPLTTRVQDCYRTETQELQPEVLQPLGYELNNCRLIMTHGSSPGHPGLRRKELLVEPTRILVSCVAEPGGGQPFRFALDFNLLPLAQLRIDGREVGLRAISEAKRASKVDLRHHTGAELCLQARNRDFTVWHYPIETISSSEHGAEKIYQGTALILSWEVSGSSEVFELELTWQPGARL